MSSQEGRQSPPPETQSGKQLQDPPSDGHGVNDSTSNKETSKAQLEALSSNPGGPLDQHVKDVTSKTVNHPANASDK
ncbi:hypothetical protein BP6252_10138 [Coleophoma cylindrospora]|uniref:Uncharacterized protein n=1 Tax=Coleophoma cylindrospora TaxID=1849047 RepID=A0A3D8QXE1_9HELO|nr:hypothetical protein BP6252_10138 [Coleophoma cylindrospora]